MLETAKFGKNTQGILGVKQKFAMDSYGVGF
jgi:hypothetical protein